MPLKLIRTLVILTAILLTSSIVTLSQQQKTKIGFVPDFAKIQAVQNGAKPIPLVTDQDTCDQRLAKTLTALDAADAQIAARDLELVNKDKIIDLQEKRFIEIIGILKEYATLDNKAKKGFWKKVGDKLVKFIDVATDPATIREVLLVIAVLKAKG